MQMSALELSFYVNRQGPNIGREKLLYHKNADFTLRHSISNKNLLRLDFFHHHCLR